MMLTYKTKIILTKGQQDRIDGWIGTCRMVYNLGLEVRISAWKSAQLSVHKYELMKQVVSLKCEYDWVADVPAKSLELAIIRLDNTYKSFFKGGGFPKWASRDRYNSVSFQQGDNVLRQDGRYFNLPKMGMVKMFKDRPIVGNIKTATIKKEASGYFLCVCTDAVKPKPSLDESQVLGVDMGISYLYVDSDGFFESNPRHFLKYERELRVKNRALSRKKKGSNGRKKQALLIAKLYGKIANARKDFLHKTTTALSKKAHTIYLEDLKVSQMSKTRSLGKHIMDCGWGMFRGMLEYKTTVVVVDPKYTSQTCNDCGAKDSKSRISQSQFKCTSCGMESNADHNAAKNILSKGIALSRQRSSLEQA